MVNPNVTVVLPAFAFPALLFAQSIDCQFTRECVEFEVCEDTDYAVHISHREFTDESDNVDYTAQWIDDAVTRKVIYRQKPDFGFVMWADGDGDQFGRMVIDREMGARYVVQDATAPLMLTYYGTCQGGI